MKKTIALISGGLDSSLAAKLIREQGIEIIALNFKTPFCLCDRKNKNSCAGHALKVANGLGIEFKVVYVTDEFFAILKNPKHGYGKNLNPCIDCRILMFKKAKEFMQEVGASFIITGEVLGQRPMSQHKIALKIIERESELEGLVLRPLSAKLLPETIPEKKGWVDRNKLLNFSGRTRRPQIALAETLDIRDYPCSAGGCLLTDPQFAKRMKDLLNHGELNLNNVELLKIGRHFRLSPDAKLVVGRNEQENEHLLKLANEDDYLFNPSVTVGPVALGKGIFTDELIKLSCGVVCRYSDLNGVRTADIVYRRVPQKESKTLKVLTIEDNEIIKLRV